MLEAHSKGGLLLLLLLLISLLSMLVFKNVKEQKLARYCTSSCCCKPLQENTFVTISSHMTWLKMV